MSQANTDIGPYAERNSEGTINGEFIAKKYFPPFISAIFYHRYKEFTKMFSYSSKIKLASKHQCVFSSSSCQ